MIAVVFLTMAYVITGPVSALADRGIDLFESGDQAGARRVFEARLVSEPDDVTALYYLGRLTPQDGQAARYFERLLKVAPGHRLVDDAILALAESAYASPMGLFITARRHYRRLVEDYPHSEHRDLALYRMGKTFLITRQPDSAAAVFDRVGVSAADDLETFVLMAKAEASSMAGLELVPPVAGPVYPFETRAQTKAQRESPGNGHPAYWIQAGAFRREAGARELADRLRLAKLSVERGRNDRGLIVLRVGPFSNREEAVRVVRHLKDIEHIDAVVIAP